MKLCAELASLPVDGICQGLVKGKAFLGIERGAEAVREHRHIADDDHGAASCGDSAQAFHLLLLGKAQTGGSKDDAVFQGQPAVVQGAGDVFVHVESTPFLVAFSKSANNCFCSASSRALRASLSQSKKTW